MEQYNFGGWLKKNAGIIGTVAGGAIGTVIAPGVGTQLGASLGGSLGGTVQSADAANTAEQEQLTQNAKNNAITSRLSSIDNNVGYTPVMANGGYLQNPEMNNTFKSFKGVLGDNTVKFDSSKLHKDNPLGGTPFSNTALVEKDEVAYNSPKYGQYIFSNKF